MKNHVIRKYGRRKAGSYDRPYTKKMKFAASKDSSEVGRPQYGISGIVTKMSHHTTKCS